LATDQPLQFTPGDSKSLSSISFSLHHLLLLLVVAGCVFFVGLGRLPLLEPDEGRNAEVAREMLVSGDWITPHFNTLTYLDKPAVFFWLVAGSFRVWGLSEWAARLPSALMALATMLLAWFLARRMWGESAGLRAGVILATCPLVMAFARLVIFDMTLTFLVILAMVSFWLAEAADYRRPRFDALLFATMGVATITKGPVGFLLPLLSIAAYQALRGRLRELKRLRWGLGLAVFLAAVLPWFIAVAVRNPDFPRYALWEESLRRFATGHLHRRGNVLYYLPVYLGGFFPWSLFLLLAGVNRLKRWKDLREDSNRSVLFLLAWAGAIFVFFSISQSKLPGYFLPATIPLSLLTAKVWGEVGSEGRQGSPGWLSAGFWSLLGLGLLVAVSPQLMRFAAVHARVAKKLHPAVIGLLNQSLLLTGLILVAMAILGRNLAARMRGKPLALLSFMLVALAVPVLLLRWRAPLQTYARTASSKRLAETILASPDKGLPIYGYYYFRTSLPFYLRRPVSLVTSDAGEMTSNYIASRWAEMQRQARSRGPDNAPPGTGPPSGPGQGVLSQRLVDPADFEARVRSSAEPMLVMVRNTHVGKLAQTVGRMESRWGAWEFSVWKIPPGNPRDEIGRPFQARAGNSPAVRAVSDHR
jgi:4-amino-4-deoxy-L-arabinose transferase-like glycosyltransferase